MVHVSCCSIADVHIFLLTPSYPVSIGFGRPTTSRGWVRLVSITCTETVNFGRENLCMYMNN